MLEDRKHVHSQISLEGLFLVTATLTKFDTASVIKLRLLRSINHVISQCKESTEITLVKYGHKASIQSKYKRKVHVQI